MERQRLNLLYVTSPPNLYYLLAYSSVCFDPRNPIGVAVPLDPAPPLMCESADHDTIRPAAMEDGLTYGKESFYYPGALDEVIGALKARG